MLLLSRQNALDLSTIPGFSHMLHQLDKKNNMANQRRITAAIGASAEKRYREFAACYPELLGRFPQHIIASYVGFTKDTLSRLKNKHVKY
ncbi:cyclic nucleotide-binding domain-containing protein [Spirosoma aureum]|uniref:hypothetical protein n=1 Tax=Spirosoma aureum TaxID=2692134 RepID=UPI0018D94307|nr:hypothetical protein [Spirosoma aureum]